jgi:transcriptional regulator with XRE-family HTH domain
VVIDLAGIRRAAGLTQIELAANMGVGQAHISKIERQSDMLLSTLASYLSAVGARTELVVDVGGRIQTFSLDLGRGDCR